MDYQQYKVHRWRYPNWIPSPIRSIACDPSTARVALGREDGTIELASSSSKWHTLARIYGQTDFKLQSLTYFGNGQLFGISLKGFLFQVDFSALELKNIRDCYGGSAWCLAASKRTEILAVGCEDGSARIFTYDSILNQVEYARTVPTTGSRVLSIAFHPTMPKLFLGCADGTIRCVDETNGRAMFRMTGEILRGVQTRIWSLVVLSDSTVISGDSRGHVQFWDGQIGVLMATIQQHTAEVLTLSVSSDESQVFASGTDSRVTCMKRISIAPSEVSVTKSAHGDLESSPLGNTSTVPHDSSPADNQWVHTTAQRHHSHDVYALAIIDDANGGRLVSGGLDCKLCEYSLSKFAHTRPSWVLPTPAQGLVSSTMDGDCSGWSIVRHRTHLDLWALRGRVSSAAPHQSGGHGVDGDSTGDSERQLESLNLVDLQGKKDIDGDGHADKFCNLALRLEVKDPCHLHCCAIANMPTSNVVPAGDGEGTTVMICLASSSSGCRAWRLDLHYQKNDVLQDRAQKIRKIPLPDAADVSCTAMALSEDGRVVVLAASNGTLVLLDVSMSLGDSDTVNNDVGVGVTVRHIFNHRQSVTSLLAAGGSRDAAPGLEGAVVQMALSSDGLWLAIADAAERSRTYVYDLDRLRLHWSLPRSPAPVASLGFHPSSPSSLVQVLADNSFILQDVAQLKLCPWSETVPPKSMPEVLRKCPGPLQGLSFAPDNPSIMILYGQGFFVYVDIDQPVSQHPRVIVATSPRSIISGVPENDETHFSVHNAMRDKKRRRDFTTSKSSTGIVVDNRNFTMVHRYRGLVHLKCLAGNNLVMVENPWLGIIAQLPDTLARKRYGT